MVMVLMMMSDSDVVMIMVVAAVMINADHFFVFSVGQTGLHVGVLEQLLPTAGWFGQRTNPGV